MKKFNLLIICFFCVLILSPIIGNAETYKLTVGSIEAVGGNQYNTMQWVIDQINKRSNGQIIIEYFPANQLGTTAELLDSVAAGTIDINILGCNGMGSMGKDWIVDGIPFMFRSAEHRKLYNNSELSKIRNEQLLETHGIRAIAQNWYRTPHVLATTKPVREVGDLKGLKMRIPEARGQYLGWSALGTNPTMITWGEVYLALKQGVVEGVSPAFDLLPETKFYEVAPYILMLNCEWSYDFVMMNNKSYMNLPEDLRNLVVKVFNEAGKIYTDRSWVNYYNTLENLPKKGAQILFLDTTPFLNKVFTTLPEKLDKEGLLEKEKWDKIQSLVD